MPAAAELAPLVTLEGGGLRRADPLLTWPGTSDFARLFGQETPSLPPITAIAVGADSDNTQGHSLGYLTQLRWLP